MTRSGFYLNHVHNAIAIHELIIYCHSFQETFCFLLCEWLGHALINSSKQGINFAFIFKEVVFTSQSADSLTENLESADFDCVSLRPYKSQNSMTQILT